MTISHSKYHNRKITLYGIEFPSGAEGARYLALRDDEKRGRISSLRLQVPFELVPKQRGERAKD